MIPAGTTALPDAAGAGAILRRQTAPEYIGSWKWNAVIVHLFGYKTGKAGTENKNELPPPHDKVLLFGEAILFGCGADKKLVNFDTKEYTKFYNEAFAGFEDLGEEDTDDEDDDADTDEEEEEEGEAEESSPEDEEDTESVPVVVSDDEEDERPAPRIVVSKQKRPNKKIPTWFSLPELKPEPYTLTKALTTAAE